MKLKHLINNIKEQVLSIGSSTYLNSNFGLVNIKGLSLNSKLVKKGDLFFCLPGLNHKGSDFIKEAYKKESRVIMVDEQVKTKLPGDLLVIRVKDVISSLGIIANKFYGQPLRKLNSIAITGTNGKTSTTYIIESIIKSHRKPVGVIGTVNYRFANNRLIAKNTTPDIITNYDLINRMLKKNIKYLIMEVSSHALAQRRIEGLKFDQAIFTNLSQDHFDYHKTKDRYFIAKSKLFTDYLNKDGVAIINVDDVYGFKLMNLIKKNKNKILTYGIKRKADINASSILLKNNGSSFIIRYKKLFFSIDTNLIGVFNIYNILAAIASCLVLGIPKESIVKGVRDVYIPGRLELIRSKNNLNIFVDYAHSQDALENILFTLKNLRGPGRLIVVFGCGGNRDKDKRHKMGRVASKLADFVIITSDNPRFEKAEDIIEDIKKGVRNKNCITLGNRRRAIEKAIDIAKSKDIIIVAGKGHEGYQIIRNRKIPFSDHDVIKNILYQRGIA